MSPRPADAGATARLSRRSLLTATGLAAASPGLAKPPGPLPERAPAALGFDPERLALADAAVAEAVAQSGVPGAVFLVGRRDGVALRKAYGAAVLRPEPRPMAADTVFDLASLTKIVGPTTAIALLVEAGRVELDAPVSRYLPVWATATGDRPRATVRHLLTHTAGVPAGGPYANKTVTLTQMVGDIVRSREVAPPGQRFLYSDHSAAALGAIVEMVTGESLDRFCRERVYAPLGMNDTGYRPPMPVAARCAATNEPPPAAPADMPPTPPTLGLVHDPTARALGGVCGNAGLFSTADDLARFCRMWLAGGSYGKVRLLKPETVRLFTDAQPGYGEGKRALGWDRDSAYSIRGGLPEGSYGHTGFTGTSFWLDPKTQTFIVLLTNAVHGDEAARRVVIPLRRTISTLVAAAIPELAAATRSSPA